MNKQKQKRTQSGELLLPMVMNGKVRVSGEYESEVESLGMVAEGKRKY